MSENPELPEIRYRRIAENPILSQINSARTKANLDLETTKISLDKDRREKDHKRSGWIEDARAKVTVFIVYAIGGLMILFTILIFIAGLSPNIPPYLDHNTAGIKALEELFVKMTDSADTVLLIALGFFFREYMGQLVKRLTHQS